MPSVESVLILRYRINVLDITYIVYKYLQCIRNYSILFIHNLTIFYKCMTKTFVLAGPVTIPGTVAGGAGLEIQGTSQGPLMPFIA